MRWTPIVSLSTLCLAAAAAASPPTPPARADSEAKAAPQRAGAAARQAPADASSCAPLPPPASLPWDATERLYYDVDVMGALAGKLTLFAHPPTGAGEGQEMILRAMAASNSFFSKIRQVRGRSASHVRTHEFRPRRYQEESQEGGVDRSAEVDFRKEKGGKLVAIDWKRDGRKGRRRYPSQQDVLDPVSAAYALRTLDLQVGAPLCFDVYGIRTLWRVQGSVREIETVKVPAGTFQAYRLEGVASRVDDPRRTREIHLWISADERRLPLAALSVMDLGPVRAQLARVGGAIDEEMEDVVLSGLPPPPPAPKPVRRLKR